MDAAGASPRERHKNQALLRCGGWRGNIKPNINRKPCNLENNFPDPVDLITTQDCYLYGQTSTSMEFTR